MQGGGYDQGGYGGQQGMMGGGRLRPAGTPALGPPEPGCLQASTPIRSVFFSP